MQEIGSYAFQAAGLVSITIPSKVETLGILSFERCENLQTVNFSDGIKGLELYCFEDCTALENIYFEGNAPRISNDVFKGVTSMVYFPAGDATWTEDVKKDYGGTLTWKEWNVSANGIILNQSELALAVGEEYQLIANVMPTGATNKEVDWNSQDESIVTVTDEGRVSPSSGAEGYLIYAQKNGKYGYVGMTTKGTAFTDIKALDADYNYYWMFPYITNSTGK